MRQKSGTRKATSEQVVKDIRRVTRKHYSAEEKIRVVLDGLRGEDSIAELAVARVSTRTSITAGRRNSWRRARSGLRATPRGRRPRRR